MEAASGHKVRSILWNDNLEVAFRHLKIVVSAQNLLNYPGWVIVFTVHIDTSDKTLGAIIGQIDKPIAFF